jgi:hypothetical protein
LAYTIIKSADEDAWLEARRAVLTATRVRDLAKGYGADRRRILVEMVNGTREDLSGNQYVNWGNAREPLLAAWAQEKFGVTPNPQNDLYVWGDDPRWAATPDGTGIDLALEIKTSKHDLDPEGAHFAKSGYYDQMQWQMMVTETSETLFVWEQHDDQWPTPNVLPVEHRFIQRDDKRIAELVKIAEEFWAEMLEYRDGPKKASDDPLVNGEIPDEIAVVAQLVMAAREREALAKKEKEEAWARLQELTANRGDFKAHGHGLQISFTTSRKVVKTFDEEAARAKSKTNANLLDRYAQISEKVNVLREKFTIEEVKESTTLYLGAQK